MADRENAIKRLKYLHDVEHWTPSESSDEAKARRTITTEVIELLKAQEPVKPIIQRGWYRCGNCRNGIASVLDTGKPSHQQAYCDMCGREVKWE